MTNLTPNINQKPWTEVELISRLSGKEFLFPPVDIELLNEEYDIIASNPDGVVEISWKGRKSRFVFEYKGTSSPKALETAVAQAQRYAKEFELSPLVIVPYLSEKSLQFLEAENVSGLDLSGNGTILTPHLAVRQSGRPNLFRESSSIRNVFQGNSSLLARCFLLRSEYASSNELRTFASCLFSSGRDRRGSIFAKGTVSKVTQALEEENIISRTKDGLRLIDCKALLEKLKTNYQKPRGERIMGKTPLNETEIWTIIASDRFRAVVTGDGSAGHYRVLSGQDRLTLYVDDLQRVQECLEVKSSSLFPNIELIEEGNDLCYFDARLENGILWASPIQTWLELAASGPRERTAAEQLEAIFLKGKGATL